MKHQFLTIILLLFVGFGYAQTLKTIKKYHDPYSRTTLKEVYTVVENTNTKHGSYKSYDSKGHLTQKGSYKDGVQHGQWIIYYGAALASLRNDYQNWIDKVKEVVNYSNGRRHGSKIGYIYPNGKKIIEFKREYDSGDLVKETTYWDNGQKQSVVEVGGICTSWNQKGIKIVEYRLNETASKEGAYQEWYDDGSKYVSANYNNGNLIGDCKQWFPSGSLQIEQHYSSEFILTKNLEFYSNGKRKSELYCDNSNCKETLYDSLSGQKIAEVEFIIIEEHDAVKFYREGKEVNYFSDGTIKSKGLNKSDERVGEWVFYDKNGNVEYYEVEDRYGRRTKKTPEEIEAEKQAEKKRIEEENRRKLVLKQEQELKENKSILSEKIKKVESDYEVYLKKEVVVLDNVISEEKYVSKNKKWLYEAYKILETKYQEDLNAANSNRSRIEVMEKMINLTDRMIELAHEETDALEKSLKKENSPSKIAEILGL